MQLYKQTPVTLVSNTANTVVLRDSNSTVTVTDVLQERNIAQQTQEQLQATMSNWLWESVYGEGSIQETVDVQSELTLCMGEGNNCSLHNK